LLSSLIVRRGKALLRILIFTVSIFLLTSCLHTEKTEENKNAESSTRESAPHENQTPTTQAAPPSQTSEQKDPFSHLDPENEIPKKLLKKAVDFYSKNSKRIRNKEYIGIIDFSQHSSRERFYIVDMMTGTVERYLVAHGRNSDPDHDGKATQFSNVEGSLMSSQGLYLTAENYQGKYGLSLRLDGLSSTNSLARKRAIVIHGADYVFPGNKIGRSYGCPAIEHRFVVEVIEKIKNGALLLAE
jgi:hypothetical protein